MQLRKEAAPAKGAAISAPARILSRAEKRRARSVADYVKAIGRVMAKGAVKNKAIETALRAEFGEEFFPTNYREAWKKIPPNRKADAGRPLVNNPQIPYNHTF
jgi:hypothetical protein